jgi:large subunit ribosomal protein L25
LNIDGKATDVVVKDLQRHPARLEVLHADFMRVSKTKALQTKAPLHFINEDICIGIKIDGGIVQHMLNELEISCLAKNLPEYIEVDMAEAALGDTVHISDIKLPEGVTSVALSHGTGHDLTVASVIKPKGLASDDEAIEEAAIEGEEEAGEE